MTTYKIKEYAFHSRQHEHTIQIPTSSTILTTARYDTTNHNIVIYAMVDPEIPDTEEYVFRIRSWGSEEVIEDDDNMESYIATAYLADMPFHVFLVDRPPF